MRPAPDIERIAGEVLPAWDHKLQIEPFTSREGGLSLEDAYRATAEIRRMREARGERVIGRKIGFTNRTIWDEYKVHAPIWGYMYDTSVHDLGRNGQGFALSPALEPRIEPEIAVHLASPPDPDMDERALLECIDWVAHGFEIVRSLYPRWSFAAADTVAGFGLHGSYFIGPRRTVSGGRDRLLSELSNFEIELLCGGVLMDRGHARNVLGGPLAALRHLIGLLQTGGPNPPLAAGEIVTTGTLTRALPIMPGETWSTTIHGLDLGGIEISFDA